MNLEKTVNYNGAKKASQEKKGETHTSRASRKRKRGWKSEEERK
jgi:hypothetical protein